MPMTEVEEIPPEPTYCCSDCSATFTDGVSLYRHTGQHIEQEWDEQKDRILPAFRAIEEERPVSAKTETITAADLTAGDIVTCIPRDGERQGLAVGRAQIESVEPYSTDSGYMWLRFAFRSRNCISRCSEQPYTCWHFGEAGGGTGRVLATQKLDRYVREA